MRINSITLQNYRCFQEQSISFEKNMTLFVGKNGTGKTAVLDAAAIAASTFLYGFPGITGRNIQKDDARYEFYDLNGVIDPQPQFPVLIKATGECHGQKDITWTRSLSSAAGSTRIKDAQELIAIASDMQMQVMKGNSALILPLLLYYGTGRLYAQKREKKNRQALQQFNRQIGYLDCMAAESNEKLMLSWFEIMTMKSLQDQQKTGNLKKTPQLTAVDNAVCRCFEKISRCSHAQTDFELETRRIIISYETPDGRKCRFAMNELSDGYKNTLSMIADIAYRMAVLNPQLGEAAPAETPGIVLIDEIDLHLHPEWQQTILKDLQELFPKIQFLVTSHAPAVINSVNQENIRILDAGKIYTPSAQTYGRDVNSILREVMQTGERPKEIEQLLHAFYQAIDQQDIGQAESVLQALENTIGENDPELSAARVKLDFAKMQEEWD